MPPSWPRGLEQRPSRTHWRARIRRQRAISAGSRRPRPYSGRSIRAMARASPSLRRRHLWACVMSRSACGQIRGKKRRYPIGPIRTATISPSLFGKRRPRAAVRKRQQWVDERPSGGWSTGWRAWSDGLAKMGLQARNRHLSRARSLPVPDSNRLSFQARNWGVRRRGCRFVATQLTCH